MAASLDLIVSNEGQMVMYIRRSGVGVSIPVVIFVIDGLVTRVERWRIFEGYTVSDHQYIVFGLKNMTRTVRIIPFPVGWNEKKLDVDRMTAQID